MDVIETDRLVLRRQRAQDAPFILRLLNDPDWLRYIGDRGVRTVDQARAYISDGPMAMYDRYGFGLYLVETRSDRTPVGICGLIQRDFLDCADLGFALAREFRGMGYASEAAMATVDYARASMGLDRLDAIVSPENATSIRLLERLGFTFERKFIYPGADLVYLYTRALVAITEP